MSGSELRTCPTCAATLVGNVDRCMLCEARGKTPAASPQASVSRPTEILSTVHETAPTQPVVQMPQPDAPPTTAAIAPQARDLECAHCGGELAANASYCAFCGIRVGILPVTCASCGT